MTKSIEKKKTGPIEIDLTGPEGNVFVLMGIAKKLAKTLNLDADAIIADMKSDDYEHALEVMEKHFGDYIIMYR